MTEPSLLEESIFCQALELKVADQRKAFLDRACQQNQALRAEVEALLRANQRSGDLLDLPEKRTPALNAPQTDEPGALIAGRYKLLENIGEGGMGAVWMAQQTEPVKRLVAIKLIKVGMCSKAVLARFEAERQALALMDHPHIAKVLDAGAASDGRPFFVMELVKGVPITRFCDEHRLTPRQRLEMFMPVCHAIQHAHQKGIIHRDLKPSNVLVALYDDRPVPKVIDFGVAKATGQPLTEQTLHTGFGAVVGTVEYMSPEQASFNQLDVDTRSDIYSLGVILYELLTGTPPFTRTEVEKAGVLEMLRLVREEEPSKPSTKLSTAAGLPTLAANRGTESAKLPNLLRGELDWIVMKALEKDRCRRYETANGLALDLQRYLKDEPVQACPPSAMYRFRKFARRNKTTLLAGSLIAAALVAGTVVSTWQAIRAESNLAEAQRQRALAESSYQQARRAVDELFVHIGDDVTLNQPEFQPLRAELLQSALSYYQEFIETWKEEPAKRAELATSYWRVAYLTQQIGALPEALSSYEKSVALQQELVEEGGDSKRINDLAGTWIGLGRAQQSAGRHTEAAGAYDQALTLWQSLAEKAPAEPRYLDGQATALNNLGFLYSERNQLDEALRCHEQALAIREQLVKDHPDSPQWRFALAGTYSNLGNRLTEARQPNEALVAHHKRLVVLQKLVQQQGAKTTYEREIGGALNSIGDVYRRNRRRPGWAEKAIAAYSEARAIQERLVRDHPTSIASQSSLANTLINTGQVYRFQKKYSEALPAIGEAIVLLDKLVRVNPEGVPDLSSLGSSYVEKGRVLAALNRRDDAVVAFEQAVACHERLVRLAPSIERYQSELVGFRQELEQIQKKN